MKYGITLSFKFSADSEDEARRVAETIKRNILGMTQCRRVDDPKFNADIYKIEDKPNVPRPEGSCFIDEDIDWPTEWSLRDCQDGTCNCPMH